MVYMKRKTYGRRKKAPKQLVTKKQLTVALNKNMEKRYYRASNTISLPNWSSSNVSFDHVGFSQGTGNGNRTGLSIIVKSIKFRGGISVADGFNVVRLVAFQYHDLDSTAPLPENIFDNNYSISSLSAHTPYAHFNLENKSAYTILYDKLFVLSNSVGGHTPCGTFNITIPGSKLRPVTYTTSGVTTGNNHIYLCALSDSSVASHPVMNYVYEVNYIA